MTRNAYIAVPSLSADPAIASEAGSLYYNSGTTKLRVYSGTAWADVSTGGSDTPATSVVAETAYGQSSTVGTSTNYARQDHTHGSPSLTATAASTQAFGDSATVGTGTAPAREDHKHAMPATPVTSFATRTGAVTATAADIGAGTFPAGTFDFSGDVRIPTANALRLHAADTNHYVAYNATPNGPRLAGFDGVDIGHMSTGSFVQDLAVGSAGINATRSIAANGGVSIPAAQTLVVGTKTIASGSQSLTATANTTYVFGQFTTTSGSMALRLHMHLAVAGGLVQRTKTYEFVVDVNTDTTNTFYKLLPADQSTPQATASDVYLMCYRPTTAATTWQIWAVTSQTFISTATLNWTIESYADTSAVTSSRTLSPATSFTATLPWTGALHPSNSLDTVAGNTGIGTDAPGTSLDVVGTARATTLNGTTDVQFNGNSVPRGEPSGGRGTSTASVGPTSSTTLLNIVTATVSVVTNRKYLVFGSAFEVTTTVAADRFNWSLNAGATQVTRMTKVYDTVRATNDVPQLWGIWTANTTGSVTFAFSIARIGGTGTATIPNSAGDPAVIEVVDIGV